MNELPALLRPWERQERAKLLGYPDYAQFVLEDSMARSPEAADALLRQLWEPGEAARGRGGGGTQAVIDEDGGGGRVRSPLGTGATVRKRSVGRAMHWMDRW